LIFIIDKGSTISCFAIIYMIIIIYWNLLVYWKYFPVILVSCYTKIILATWHYKIFRIICDNTLFFFFLQIKSRNEMVFHSFYFHTKFNFQQDRSFWQETPIVNTNIIVLSQMFERDSNIHQVTRNQIHSCLEFLTSCLWT
jgi:hypothetical protein